MANEIDRKVVEMRFNNQRFEAGVKETLSSLDKLRQSLAFGKETDTFSAFEKSAIKSLDTVQLKFSALEVAAVSAINNITNRAVNAGVSLVKSLSVDNIASGWKKFNEMTNSSGTLVSQGYSMETVEKQLERLNWYTDETSYNFTDMVSNIAKFTAAGKDLEESVTAMMGIANWAALSGQNASVASRAMYNISQAMSAGSMKAIDWKSIQLASMNTMEFQQIALDTAVAMGRLKENADGTYEAISSQSRAIKPFPFVKTNFMGSLVTGWFDSDVMMEVFNKYASVIDKVREYAETNGVTASEAMSDLEDELDAFGLKALRAGQEARTLSDALDAVKDAVSTGFMNTFQNIFGNYAEAKILWTQLANELYEVFAESGNERNAILKEWKDMGGRMDFLQSLWNGFHNLVNIIDAIKEGFSEIFPSVTAERLYEITNNLKSLSERLYLNSVHLEVVKTAAKGVFAVFDMIVMVFKAVLKGLEPIIGPIENVGYYIEAIIYKFSSMLIKMDENAEEFGIFEAITQAVSNALAFLLSLVGKLLTFDIRGFFSGIGDAALTVVGILLYIGETVANIFSEITGIDIASPITDFSERLRNDFSGTINDAKNQIIGFFLYVKNNIASKLTELFGELSAGDFTTNFRNILSAIFVILQGIGTISFVDLVKTIKNFGKATKDIKKSAVGILDSVRECFEAYQQRIKAQVLKTIAVSIGILTLSLIALSKLDTEGLATGLIAITTLFVELSIVMKKVAGIVAGTKHLKSLKVTVDYLIAMSASVVLLSIAMKNLAGIEIEDMVTALIGVSGLLLALVRVSTSLSTNTSLVIKGASSFVLLAAAINMMVPSVVALGNLGWEEAVVGLSSVFGLIGGLVLMLVASGEILKGLPEMAPSLMSVGATLILVAAALDMIIPPLLILGSVDPNVSTQGLFTLLFILLELGVFLAAMNSVNPMAGVGTLIAIGLALIEIVPPLIALGTLPDEMISDSLKRMAAVIGELLALCVAVGLAKTGALAGAGTLIALGLTLNAIITPMLVLGSLPVERVGQGLYALSLIFAELILFLYSVRGMGAFDSVGTILALSAAMVILTAAVSRFGISSLSILGASVAFAALIGVAKVVSTMSASLLPAIPVMIKMASAFAIFGVGASLLTPALIGMAAATPVFIEGIKAIAGSAKELRESLTIIGDEFMIWLEDMIPLVVRVASDLILGLLLGLLQSLNVYLEPILIEVIDILIDVVKVLGEPLMKLVDVIVDVAIYLIIEIIEKLAQVIRDDGMPILAALLHVIDAIFILIAECFGADGNQVKRWLEDGREQIKEWASDFSGVITMVTAALAAFAIAFFGLAPVPAVVAVAIIALIAVIAVFKDDIVGFYQYTVKYVQGGIAKIADFFSTVWWYIKDYFHEAGNAMHEFGMFLVNGLVEGLQNAKDWLIQNVQNIGDSVINGFKDIFKIDSPSKVTEELGGYLDSGLVSGLKGKSKDVNKAINKVGEDSLETLRDTLGTHSDSDETTEMGEELDTGLGAGVKNKAGELFNNLKSFGESVLSTIGIDVNFDNFFNLGETAALGLGEGYKSGLSESAKKIISDSALRSGISDVDSAISSYEKQQEQRVKQERIARLKQLAASGVTLNSEDKKFLADAMVESLDPNASISDITKKLQESDLFDIKDIQIYAEELKKADKSEKDLANSTSSLSDSTNSLSGSTDKLIDKLAEAKKAYDEIQKALVLGYINQNEYDKKVKELLGKYPEYSLELNVYIKKQWQAHLDERLDNTKKLYDDILSLYKEGAISEKEYNRYVSQLFKKYPEYASELTVYTKTAIAKAREDALSAFQEKLGELSGALEQGVITKKDFDTALKELVKKYPDAKDMVESYTKIALETAKASAVSAFKSEMESFAYLLTRGIITKDEFDKQLKELLKKYPSGADIVKSYTKIALANSEKEIADAFRSELDSLAYTLKKGIITQKEYEESIKRLTDENPQLLRYMSYSSAALVKASQDVIKDGEDAYGDFLELYESGLMSREDFYENVSSMLSESPDMLGGVIETVTSKLKNTLGVVKDNIEDLAGTLRAGFSDIITFQTIDDRTQKFRDKLDNIKSERDSFAQKMATSFESAFTFKTNKDVIDELNEKLEESNKLYGEGSYQSKRYQKEIEKRTKAIEKYKKENKGYDISNDVAEVSFGDTLKRDTEELKLYNERMQKLIERGIDTNLLESIRGMDRQQGIKAMEYLLNLDEKEWNKQLALWHENQTEAAKAAGTSYAQDKDEAQKAFLRAYTGSYFPNYDGTVDKDFLDKTKGSNVVGMKVKNNFKDITKELNEYSDLIAKCSKLGYFDPETVAGPELFNYIIGLPRQQAIVLMNDMIKWSKADKEDFLYSFSEMVDASNRAADTAYKPTLEKATQDFKDDITNLANELGLDEEGLRRLKEAGGAYLMAFAQGFSESETQALDIIGLSTDDLANYISRNFGIAVKDANAGFDDIPDVRNRLSGTVGVETSMSLASDASSSINQRIDAIEKINNRNMDILSDTNGFVKGLYEASQTGMADVRYGFSSVITSINDKRLIIDMNSLADGLSAPLNRSIGRMIAQRGRA